MTLHSDVVLECNLESGAVQINTLMEAWQELSPFSVESSHAGFPNVFEFATQHCIYFAAILQEKQKEPERMTEADLGRQYAAILDAPFAYSEDAGQSSRVPVQTHFHLPGPPRLPFDSGVLGNRTSVTNSCSPPPYPNISTWHTTPRSHVLSSHVGPTNGHSQWNTIGITYVVASDMQNEANVGIALLPDWRGKGIATHALALALSWAFTQYACHRVQGLIMDGPFRDVARAALTSLGFSHEGTRRRAVLSTAFVGWRDVTYMAMLDTDWVTREHRKPRAIWDEMFKRHHREREELLQFETRLKELRRASSAETIRIVNQELMSGTTPSSPLRTESGFEESDADSECSRSSLPSSQRSSVPSSSVEPFDSLPPSRATSVITDDQLSISDISIGDSFTDASEGSLYDRPLLVGKSERQMRSRGKDSMVKKWRSSTSFASPTPYRDGPSTSDGQGYQSDSSSGWALVS